MMVRNPSKLSVTSDYKWKAFDCEGPTKSELKEFVRKHQVDPAPCGWFRHNLTWFNVAQFSGIGRDEPVLREWDGYMVQAKKGNKYLPHMGLLIRISDNGKMFQIGKYQEK